MEIPTSQPLTNERIRMMVSNLGDALIGTLRPPYPAAVPRMPPGLSVILTS